MIFLILGLLGLAGSTVAYLKVDPDSAAFGHALLAYAMSWVVMMLGVWWVFA